MYMMFSYRLMLYSDWLTHPDLLLLTECSPHKCHTSAQLLCHSHSYTGLSLVKTLENCIVIGQITCQLITWDTFGSSAIAVTSPASIWGESKMVWHADITPGYKTYLVLYIFMFSVSPVSCDAWPALTPTISDVTRLTQWPNGITIAWVTTCSTEMRQLWQCGTHILICKYTYLSMFQ